MLPVGTSFLLPSYPSKTEHLYILVAVKESAGKALMVNVTTPKDGCDESCKLALGEHRFLKYDSVINYADSRIVNISDIEQAISYNIAKPHDPFENELLKRIQAGGLISPAISFKHLTFLSENI